ncbi:MAG: CARDB domain-containing protein [Candidatus Zixiibacteriota bacterium]
MKKSLLLSLAIVASLATPVLRGKSVWAQGGDISEVQMKEDLLSKKMAEIQKVFRLRVKFKDEKQKEALKRIGLECEPGETDVSCKATVDQMNELKSEGIEFEVEMEGIEIGSKHMDQGAEKGNKGVVWNENSGNYWIPYGNWIYSPITISSAPSWATVYSIDMHYRVIHPYVGDLAIDLTDQDLGHQYRLWNYQGGSTHNIDTTIYMISFFNGESVNQTWKLWGWDCCAGDSGYIDDWSIQIWYQDLPDLVIQSLTATNYNPQAGTYINVTMVIKNQGSGSASGCWDGLFYNLSSPPTTNTPEDQAFFGDALEPGSTQSYTFYNVTSSQVGTWHMYGLADCDSQVRETNENNNYSGPVDINWTTPPQPDFIIQSLTPSSSSPTVGDTISVTLVIKNQGGSSASSFWTDLFKNRSSAPSVPSNGDYCWYTSLGAGQTEPHTFTGITSSTAGTWHMYGLTDSRGQIQESNENNNVAGPVDVVWNAPQPKPDLIVEDVCVGNDQPEVGDSVNVMVVIKNQGAATASNFFTDLYYNRTSPPVPLDEGDDYFSTTSLAPGATKAYPFYIGSEAAASWSMYVQVDSWNQVHESNENNNVWGPEYVTWSWPAKAGSITRNQIIQNGWPYILLNWVCPPQNATPPDPKYCVYPNNDEEWTSDFVVGQPYRGEAYEWGGWDDTNAFLTNMNSSKGQRAGVHINNDCLPDAQCNPCWSTGIDCSGFVSRCWHLSWKHNTRTLFDVADTIPYDQLQRGDALDDTTQAGGRHVRLFLQSLAGGRIRVMESIAYGVGDTLNRCNTNTYAESLLVAKNYIPIRYNNVSEPPLLPGDCTNDGIVNAGDVLWLVWYIYRNASPPIPMCTGNVNDDEVIDGGDIVYLVNYLFKGGPRPVNHCT